MLVLSRRPDQAIVIGDDIVVRVLGIERGGQVRLGIEAPRSCRILRQELLEEVESANRAAAESVPDPDRVEVLQDWLGGAADRPDADG